MESAIEADLTTSRSQCRFDGRPTCFMTVRSIKVGTPRAILGGGGAELSST